MSRKMLIDSELNNSNEEEMNCDFDLFVIGAGSGGVRAARTSAGFGVKLKPGNENIKFSFAINVAICEFPFHPISSEVVGGVGGTCIIRGCVPKKILVYGASFGGELEDARSFGRQKKMIMKLVVDTETEKVLGASMCGPDAPEIMQGIAIALKCGATKAQFDSTVGIHPPAAEEFVTMRSVTRCIAAGSKPKKNL